MQKAVTKTLAEAISPVKPGLQTTYRHSGK